MGAPRIPAQTTSSLLYRSPKCKITHTARLQNTPPERLVIQSLPLTAICMQHNNTKTTHHKWISPSLCVVGFFYWLIAIVAELLYCQGQVLTHVQSRPLLCPDPQRLLEPGNKQERTNFRDKWILKKKIVFKTPTFFFVQSCGVVSIWLGHHTVSTQFPLNKSLSTR